MNKQAWMDRAQELGFDAFEIYRSMVEETQMTWFEGSLDTFVSSHVTGTALRGLVGEKMANLATEDPRDEEMDETLQGMKEMAETITSEDAGIIRSPMDIHVSAKTKKWKKPSEDKVKEVLGSIEKKIKVYDKRIKNVTDLIFVSQKEVREIANTHGIDLSDEAEGMIIMCQAAASEGEVVKTNFISKVVEDLDTFDEDAFVKKLCDELLARLGGSSVPSGNYKVIMEKGAMTSLFRAFAPIFSGENVAEGVSPLTGKIGEKLFADCITIVDDPQCAAACGQVDFDDEGCACTKKELVSQGVLKTIIHNSKSAAKMSTESTGNGFKASYASSVGVKMMNCCIEQGTKSLAELCTDMGEGIVITDLAGLHAGVNTVTGDFSLQCSGYAVQNGVRTHSVELITIAGNFLDLLADAEAVANDLEWEDNTIVSPSIAVKSCSIAGE